jgi:hypothetical protein
MVAKSTRPRRLMAFCSVVYRLVVIIADVPLPAKHARLSEGGADWQQN